MRPLQENKADSEMAIAPGSALSYSVNNPSFKIVGLLLQKLGSLVKSNQHVLQHRCVDEAGYREKIPDAILQTAGFFQRNENCKKWFQVHNVVRCVAFSYLACFSCSQVIK